jgi:acyl carrier protein
MTDNVRERLVEIVVQYTGVSREEVLSGAAFSDLGCDSLDVVEIGILVDQAFDVELQGKVAGRNLPRNLTELEQSVLACLPTTTA